MAPSRFFCCLALLLLPSIARASQPDLDTGIHLAGEHASINWAPDAAEGEPPAAADVRASLGSLLLLPVPRLRIVMFASAGSSLAGWPSQDSH